MKHTVINILRIAAEKYSDKPYTCEKDNNGWVKRSFQETREYKNVYPEKWIPVTFQVVEESFSDSNKMINSTGKMVRHKIVDAYKDKIDFMYTSAGSKPDNENNRKVLREMFNLE